MKICSRCKVAKPLVEFHRRSNRPDGVVSHCKACKAKAAADYSSRNRAAVNARRLDWFYRNAERSRARARAWHTSNPERSQELSKRWAEENKAYRAEEFRKWAAQNQPRIRKNRVASYTRNPASQLAAAGRQRALRLQAVPLWADHAAIREIYREARARSTSTGIKHVVDHVIPLRSKHVCGLHVQANLAVITFDENAKKGNRHWPDMARAA